MSTFRLAGLLAFATAFVSSSSQAQEHTIPFGEWSLVCDRHDVVFQGRSGCVLGQTISPTNIDKSFFSLAFADLTYPFSRTWRYEQETAPIVELRAYGPKTLDVNEGVHITIDKEPLLLLARIGCARGSCSYSQRLNEGQLSRLRSATSITARFFYGDDKVYPIQFEPSGLDNAFRAWNKVANAIAEQVGSSFQSFGSGKTPISGRCKSGWNTDMVAISGIVGFSTIGDACLFDRELSQRGFEIGSTLTFERMRDLSVFPGDGFSMFPGVVVVTNKKQSGSSRIPW